MRYIEHIVHVHQYRGATRPHELMGPMAVRTQCMSGVQLADPAGTSGALLKLGSVVCDVVRSRGNTVQFCLSDHDQFSFTCAYSGMVLTRSSPCDKCAAQQNSRE